MRHWKKRTIALVLASVVTVAGAFGAENYLNSLMSLQVENKGGVVDLTLLTKHEYSQEVNIRKKDDQTYVIMLPETNSEIDSMPDLGSNIEKIDVKTMPYTTGSKGYTKITVTTAPNTQISAKKAIFIPQKETPSIDTSKDNQTHIEQPSPAPPVNPAVSEEPNIEEDLKQFENNNLQENTYTTSEAEQTSNVQTSERQIPSDTDSTEKLLLVMGLLFVIVASCYFFVRGKSKIVEVLGEQSPLDIDDEKPKKEEKKQKVKTIKKTINDLDKMYNKPVKMPLNEVKSFVSDNNDKKDDEVIVDLDEIFQQKTQTQAEKIAQEPQEETSEVNDALEDFLSSFNFEDEKETPEPQQKEFDEEYYNECLEKTDMKFSKDDTDKINKLLNSEITDDTIRNIGDYAVSEKQNKKPSKQEILEELVTTYAINQQIIFTKEDIETMYKLISVEIDKDFLTDLKTNPERIKEIEKEYEKRGNKPASKIVTLNVKNMLPDLAEALKKQNGKKIESNAKPTVVYCSEGYEVDILSIKDELPDLSKEINNKEANAPKRTEEYVFAESGYEVDKLSTDGSLPDLEDVKKHPEKYRSKEPERYVPDENEMLNSISNVSFKPFYDKDRTFEVLNDFSQYADNDEEVFLDLDKNREEVKELIDKEFNNSNMKNEVPEEGERETTDTSENIETAENTEQEEPKSETETIPQNNTAVEKEEKKSESREEIPPQEIQSSRSKRSSEAEKLLELIEKKQNERTIRKNIQIANEEFKKFLSENKAENKTASEVKKPAPEVIQEKELGEEKLPVLCTAQISENLKFYITKDENGYTVSGLKDGKLIKLKTYEEIVSENLRCRLSEVLDDGTERYIIRAGIHKFILDIKKDSMGIVTDLC